MATYKIQVDRHYTYEIEIEAKDEYEAIEKSRDWEIDDLEPYEVNAYFDTDVIGYPDTEETN